MGPIRKLTIFAVAPLSSTLLRVSFPLIRLVV